MIAKISKTENAIKIDGESGTPRIMLDIIGGDREEILSLFVSLIGVEFEITVNGNDATAQKRQQYYG